MYHEAQPSALLTNISASAIHVVMCCLSILSVWTVMTYFLDIATTAVTKVFKGVTGISHLEQGIEQYRALDIELKKVYAEKAATLYELTTSLGPIEDQIHQEELEVKRLEQTLTDNSSILQAVEDELRANKSQAETLRTEIDAVKALNARGPAYTAETEGTLAEKKASAAATEAALSRELAVLEVRLAQKRLAALQNEIASEDAAHEEALAKIQRRHCQYAFQHAALAAEARLAHEAHVIEMTSLNAEVASLEDELTALSSEVAAAHARNKSLADKRDRLVLEASADGDVLDRQLEDAAVAEAAMLMVMHDLHKADREAAAALEKGISEHEQALARATEKYNDFQDDLESSVAEHRLHMHTCDRQRAEAARQLAALEIETAEEEARLAALDEEVAALKAETEANRLAHEADLQRLESHLNIVSEDYDEECARLAAAQNELERARAAHERERRQHLVDVAACEEEQRANDALADELIEKNAQEQAHIDALEAELAGRTSFEEAQRNQDAVHAKPAGVARIRATQVSEPAEASAERAKVRRELAATDFDTTKWWVNTVCKNHTIEGLELAMAQGKLQEVPVAHQHERCKHEAAVAALPQDQRWIDIVVGTLDRSAIEDAPPNHVQGTKFAHSNFVGLSGAQRLEAVFAAAQRTRQRSVLDTGTVKATARSSGPTPQVQDAETVIERDVFGDVLAVVLDT